MRTTGAIHGLYVIADTSIITDDWVAAVASAIEGGATIVQYRDKSDDHARRLDEATALRQLCQQYGVPFIINDDVELAHRSGADGVHLGKNDTAIELAQRRLGKESIVGISCYNEISRVRGAIAAGASYIALGCFFPSAVKPDAVRANETLLTQVKREFTVPVVAIGGVTPENGARLIAAGADALAVISGIFGATDIRGAAESYATLFNNSSHPPGPDL
ncbi:MAG: thiamine phosphate synthase [Acidiferrobacterales bacterium]